MLKRDSDTNTEWLWLHIAAGVCIGILAATFITWRIALVVADQAAKEAIEQMRRITEQSQRDTKAARLADEQEAAARQRQAAEQLSKQAAAQQEKADAAARREEAWARFYRKPKECETSWTGECANDYIRAKRRFDELYDSGRLKLQ